MNLNCFKVTEILLEKLRGLRVCDISLSHRLYHLNISESYLNLTARPPRRIISEALRNYVQDNVYTLELFGTFAFGLPNVGIPDFDRIRVKESGTQFELEAHCVFELQPN